MTMPRDALEKSLCNALVRMTPHRRARHGEFRKSISFKKLNPFHCTSQRVFQFLNAGGTRSGKGITALFHGKIIVQLTRAV
jgi:hypothetical protein